MSNISIDQLGDAITAQLNTFETDVRDGVRKVVNQTMREMVEETKNSAQVRYGTYQQSIGSVVGENSLMRYSKVWRVKAPHYRRAHLLDKGHALRNGAHYSGNAHVTNAANRAFETFQRKLEEVIRDAGSEN